MSGFKYYVIDDTLPVRVRINEQGLKMSAETPDAETQSLVFKTTLLSRIEIDPWVTEIDAAEFDRLCAAVYAHEQKLLPVRTTKT